MRAGPATPRSKIYRPVLLERGLKSVNRSLYRHCLVDDGNGSGVTLRSLAEFLIEQARRPDVYRQFLLVEGEIENPGEGTPVLDYVLGARHSQDVSG